ncbi:protein-tyrosine phosphatase family protein [Desulfocurvibacter africanus]|uniref:protein-tyrosine phosphatase family protein n=1 Tax=Desulfocurvibacter africanus TaxID=873 RepID=UPI0003FDD05E|nr:dual specificity protein phosphatase family protein [Desulfocurvibacter africanus]
MASHYKVNWVTDSLAVGSAPMNHDDLGALKDQGITAILNLCAEFCDLHWIESEAGFETYYLPIPDEQAPDLPELEKALDWLDEVIYLGKRALIHCRHGIGRTGTVLNAYLLRKGLGSKLANRTLKPLKSKPVNFNQWWFIRKYGQREKPLTLREPMLEVRHMVDLVPFLAEHEQILAALDSQLGEEERLCGREHAGCCRDLVEVPLAEAVYVKHAMTELLSRTSREMCVKQAVEATRAVRQARSSCGGQRFGPEVRTAYRAAEVLCPLNEYGECLIFERRPMACRAFDLPSEQRDELLALAEARSRDISARLLASYAGSTNGLTPPRFTLPEVVSGKFVQEFFHMLSSPEAQEQAGDKAEGRP